MEYGPVTADQLRAWITEGRVNAQTLVQAEGDTTWRPLSTFPEFASALPSTPPPMPGPVPSMSGMPGNISPASPPSVPNYLVQAILCTLCCCLPLGIVAIVYAAQVNGKLQAGDFAGAQAASKNAKLWCWIAFGLGLLSNAVIIAIEFAAGVMQGIQQH
jgi:hypothetical protein